MSKEPVEISNDLSEMTLMAFIKRIKETPEARMVNFVGLYGLANRVDIINGAKKTVV